MIPYQIIARKRDGEELQPWEITQFVAAFLRGGVTDAQMSAFLMASFIRGLSSQECSALTRAMVISGEVWDLSSIAGPRIDKHSTGGVGDNVSLVLAPWVAACGVVVPMMSGRGLGHTGGTLDKLESIPGFRTALARRTVLAQLRKIGVAMLAATKNIAPADRRMYALRDVTGTVESIPLITASILSKKLAEGADGFVFDVKYGNGAFLPDLDHAQQLAVSLVRTARQAKKGAVAVITAMDQPTGYASGNACEVAEAIHCLKTREPADLYEISRTLAAEMLVLGKYVARRKQAVGMLERAIDDGRALTKLRQLIKAQRGDQRIVDDPLRLPQARHTRKIVARQTGYISAIDTRTIGWILVELGVGRKRAGDPVDHAAGLVLQRKIGNRVRKGEVIGKVMGHSKRFLKPVADSIVHAMSVSKSKPEVPPRVLMRFDGRRWKEY